MKNGSYIGLAITGIVCAVTSFVVDYVKHNADRRNEKVCMDDTKKKYLDLHNEYLDQWNYVHDKIEELEEREKKEQDTRMSDWEKDFGYKAKMAALNDERDTRINDIKENEFHYDQAVAEIKKRYQDQFDDWKIREDYSGKLAEIDRQVEAAKSAYSSQKTILSFTNTNGMNEELLKVAKDEKKRKLDELNTRKQKLESDCKAYKNNCEANATREVRSLNDRMDRSIEAVKRDIESRASEIRSARTEEMAKVVKDVVGKRTEEECGYSDALKRIEDLEEKLNNTIYDECASTIKSKTETQKVAALLRDKYEWSPATVVGVGAIPAVLGAVGIAVYMGRVFEIAGAMKEEC